MKYYAINIHTFMHIYYINMNLDSLSKNFKLGDAVMNFKI